MLIYKKIPISFGVVPHNEIDVVVNGRVLKIDDMIAPLITRICNDPYNIKTNESCQDLHGDNRIYISFDSVDELLKFLKISMFGITDFSSWEILAGGVIKYDGQNSYHVNIVFPQSQLKGIEENFESDNSKFLNDDAITILNRVKSFQDLVEMYKIETLQNIIDAKIWPINKRKDRDPHTSGARKPKKFKRY